MNLHDLDYLIKRAEYKKKVWKAWLGLTDSTRTCGFGNLPYPVLSAIPTVCLLGKKLNNIE